MFMKTNIGILFAVCSGCLFLSRCTPELYVPPCPEITGFYPSGAPFDSVVTIEGNNFRAGHPSLHSIQIGDLAIHDSFILEVPNSQTIRFRVPRNMRDGKISLVLDNTESCDRAESSTVFYCYYTAGIVSKVFGTPPPQTCTGDQCLSSPGGLDIDANGNIWVADYGNHVVRKFNRNGTQIQKTGAIGQEGCSTSFIPDGNSAKLFNPVDLTADASGGVSIAEQGNTILRYISASNGVITIAGNCFDDGFIRDGGCAAGDAKISVPTSIVQNGQDLYFIDNGHVRKKEGTCTIKTIAEKGNDIVSAKAIEFSQVIGSRGPVIITDADSDAKLKSIKPDGGVSPIPLTNNNLLIDPVAMVIDSKGIIFIADRSGHKIYAVYPDNNIVLFAGSASGYSGDGDMTGREAKFKTPAGLALDENAGLLYVSDSGNNVIRKIIILK